MFDCLKELRLAWLRFEHALAIATGRNPAAIAALDAEISRLDRQLDQ